MRNAFVKRLAAVLLALCLLTALPITGVFADSAQKTYTVTFSGGEYGVFSQSFVGRLESAYGADDVKTAAKDGRIVTVAVRLTDGESLPAAPAVTAEEGAAAELSSTNAAYGVLNAGESSGQNEADTLGNYVPAAVARNYNLVPEFYLASDTDVEYMVRFLVTGTEIEVAPTRFGKAPAGSFPLAMSQPAPVAEYTLDLAATREANGLGADGALVLNNTQDGGVPVFTFCYTQDVHVNTEYEYVTGDTVVNYNDVNLTGGAAVAGGDAGAGAGGEDIPDEDTPLAGGEDIPDEETPQAAPAAGGLNLPLMIGGAAVLVLAVLAAILAKRKRRAAEGEGE